MTDFTINRALADMRTLVKILQRVNQDHPTVLTDPEKADAAAIRSYWKRFLDETKIQQVRNTVQGVMTEEPLPTDIQTVIDRLSA